VARGAALGLFVGFVVIIGLQLVVVIPLAFLLKAQRLSAVAFTFITNQVTVFFIYPIQCMVGGYFLGQDMKMAVISERLKDITLEFTWAKFRALGGDLMAAFLLGGLIFGIIAVAVAYPIMLVTMRKIQAKQAERRAARRAKKINEMKERQA